MVTLEAAPARPVIVAETGGNATGHREWLSHCLGVAFSTQRAIGGDSPVYLLCRWVVDFVRKLFSFVGASAVLKQ